MYNTDMPSRAELPSTAKLIRSTIISAIVALVLLVTVVMPAEYAMDPTGVGRLLGLTEMGEIKQQLADEAAADEAAQLNAVPTTTQAFSPEPAAPAQQAETSHPEPQIEATASTPAPAAAAEPEWKDEVQFVLTPGEGTEFKLTMEDGAVASFHWVSDGGAVNFDAHGDGSGQSISYEKGRGVAEDEGELTAAFTGNHGWFFRNRNTEDVTLTLRTRGNYGELKRAM
ncbi:MAG: transmembrane anchor protein [Pseudoalteromonas distincta]